MLEAQNLDFDDGGGEEKEDGKKDDGKNDPEDCRTILPPGKERFKTEMSQKWHAQSTSFTGNTRYGR